MAIDLNRTITFAGKDPDWTNKLLIGAALSLVPIVNLAASGYAANLFRNVLEGRDDSEVLPAWTDWGDHFMKGLFLFLIGLAYGLVPLGLVLVAVVPTALSLLDGRGLTLAFGVAGTMALVGLAVLLALALAPVSLVGSAMFVKSGALGDAFDFAEILRRVMAALGDLVVVFVLGIVGGLLAAAVAGWIPLVGTLLISALTFPIQLMVWHALGQTFRSNFQD